MTALRNIEFASFLRWYVAVELHDPAYAKRFYCTHEILEENMIKVWDHKLSFLSVMSILARISITWLLFLLSGYVG